MTTSRIGFTSLLLLLAHIICAQSMVLWYNQPAVKWTEALPLGNGRIGAMVFGGAGTDHIQFNEETLWNGGPRQYNRPGAWHYLDTIRQLLFQGNQKDAEAIAQEHFMGLKSNEDSTAAWVDRNAPGQYQADYQPFGDLRLVFPDSAGIKDYRRDLDISHAIAHTSYSIGDTRYTREYFVSQPNQVLAIHFTASKKGSVTFQASLASPHTASSVIKLNDNTLVLSLSVHNSIMKGQAYLQVNAGSGKVRVTGNVIEVDKADDVTIYLAAGTNYKNYADATADPAIPCIDAMKGTAGVAYTQIRERHVREYEQYFNRFSINLGKNEKEALPTDQRLEQFASAGDPSLVALYVQYGRYLLIAASRPGTRPANLQGIWNDLLSPPWGSKYTTNINTEMNYWPAELLNLQPLHEPLFEMVAELAVTGQETAKDYYHAPGWVLHHNTDLWRGTAPINASNHGIWVSGGAWLCHQLWEHFLFTRDTAFLRNKAYPVMREAARFFNVYLIKDPVTGYLISTPSNSPEQGGLVAGPTMDHEIIRDLFKNCIAAGRILGADDRFLDTLQMKYSHIAPLKIGRYGQLQEWMQDIDDSSNKHRHVSHLWAQYPGNAITWDETPALMKAARQSLIYRGDAATGWSLGWKLNLWARFKEGDHAYTLIKMLLTPAGKGAGSYPNLFDAHPPFQIDGNYGGAAGVGEMLIQSHTQYIDILPALPSAFASGDVKGICARGGFTVDIRWSEGTLRQLVIYSAAGQPALIRYAGKVKRLVTKKGDKYVFDGKLDPVQ